MRLAIEHAITSLERAKVYLPYRLRGTEVEDDLKLAITELNGDEQPEPVPVRQATEPILITACMICGRQTHQNRPFGERIPQPLPRGISHGLCVECAPGWLQRRGLPQAEIAKVMEAA